MTSEAPESTSPITVTETEHTVRSSASDPITTDRTAESVQEQAVVEDLMDKQAYRIETSFMAAMDRFSSELRTLFQERMPVTSSATPPGAGQRSQERERFEPYGKSSSLSASARNKASGYGQHSQPQNEGQQVPRPVATQQEAPTQGLRFEDVRQMIEDGLAQRRPEAPMYTRPYPSEIDRTPLPRNYRLPEFTLFSGDGQTFSIEHIGHFMAQCGESDSDT
ncbi:unnamed protein product [Prunus brigantina]